MPIPVPMMRAMHWSRRFSLFLATLLVACSLGLASARADTTPPPAPEPDIASLRAQLDKLPSEAADSEALRALLAQLTRLSDSANQVIAARTGQLSDLNARLGELGPAPAAGGSEDADITRQRQALTSERNSVDADIRLARLVVVDAQQRGNEMLGKQRDLFEARLTERAASPLSRTFWANLTAAWPADLARLQREPAAAPGIAQRWAGDEHAALRLRFAADIAAERARAATATAAQVRRLTRWFDQANRTRELLRSTVRADLAVLELLSGWPSTQA